MGRQPDVIYRRLCAEELTPEALDGFERRQQVTECARWEGEELVFFHHAFTDDWTPSERRETAVNMARLLRQGGLAFGAFTEGRLIGFACLAGRLIGSRRQYAELYRLHVSEPYRGRGIGARLFRMAAGGAGELGAEKICLAAHPARETQEFYRAMGCVRAEEDLRRETDFEPMDCLLERPLPPPGKEALQENAREARKELPKDPLKENRKEADLPKEGSGEPPSLAAERTEEKRRENHASDKA